MGVFGVTAIVGINSDRGQGSSNRFIKIYRSVDINRDGGQEIDRFQRRQDLLADKVDDMSEAGDETLSTAKSHKGLHPKGIIFIIVGLQKFRLQSFTEGPVIARVVTGDGQEFGSNLQFIKHCQHNFCEILSRVRTLDLDKLQQLLSLVKCWSDPVANDTENR